MISPQELDKIEIKDDEQRTELFDILVTRGDYVKVLDDDGKPYIARIEDTDKLKEQPDGTKTQAYLVAYLNSKKVVQKTLYKIGVEQVDDLYSDHTCNSAYNDGELASMAYKIAHINKLVYIVSGKHNKKSMNRRRTTGTSARNWQSNIALPIASVTEEGEYVIAVGRSAVNVAPSDCLIQYDSSKKDDMNDIGYLNKVLSEVGIDWYQSRMVVLNGGEENFTQFKFRKTEEDDSEEDEYTFIASTTYLDLSGKEIQHDKSDDEGETQLDKVTTRATKRNNALRNQIEEQKKDSAEFSEEEEDEAPAKRGSKKKRKGKHLEGQEESSDDEDEAPTKRGVSKKKRKGKQLLDDEESSDDEDEEPTKLGGSTKRKRSTEGTPQQNQQQKKNSTDTPSSTARRAKREKELDRFERTRKQEHRELLVKHGHDTVDIFKKMHGDEVRDLLGSEDWQAKLAQIKKNKSIIKDFERDLARNEKIEHYKDVNSLMERKIELLIEENEDISQFEQKDEELRKKYTKLVTDMLVKLDVGSKDGGFPKEIVDEWNEYIRQDHVAKTD